MAPIRKILVANRGEIAVRIMHTARQLGILTVAVYSEADAQALHVRTADEAVGIGPPEPSQSYLNGEKIIRAALERGADAIHPGYGFLSENADFARAVTAAGLTFIGPPAAAITLMGDKLAARRLARKMGVNVLSGTDAPVRDAEAARSVAEQIGFPVLLKAAAGGGGKGMRIVRAAKDLPEHLERAQSEARSAFGDDAVFIEKYLESPHHIEIQIFRDAHGQGVYLFERECSIQRRHQKVIEEAPSPLMTPQLRREMGAAALRLAEACNYVGAGTVEFLVDDDRNYYFLEMNTRLQVEHPVTEMITGQDLVAWQIAVAEGKPLPLRQEDLSIKGHAIELRVYAEDPAEGFFPSTGRLFRYAMPRMPYVRVDTGVETGDEVSRYYDPLLAKLIVWGRSRAEALRRMKAAIDAYEVGGVRTTLPFGLFVMNHPAFVEGRYNTHFVESHFRPEALPAWPESVERAAVALAHHLSARTLPRYPRVPDSPWWMRRQPS